MSHNQSLAWYDVERLVIPNNMLSIHKTRERECVRIVIVIVARREDVRFNNPISAQTHGILYKCS